MLFRLHEYRNVTDIHPSTAPGTNNTDNLITSNEWTERINGDSMQHDRGCWTMEVRNHGARLHLRWGRAGHDTVNC